MTVTRDAEAAVTRAVTAYRKHPTVRRHEAIVAAMVRLDALLRPWRRPTC
jgi:hypothetical protein